MRSTDSVDDPPASVAHAPTRTWGRRSTARSAEFAYTGPGQVRERMDGRGTTSYRYDLLGRPTSRVDPAGMGTVTAAWSYDPANGKGRLASRSYGGTAFSETYEYDSDARLEEVTTKIRDGGTTETLVASYGYDSLGRPSTTTYPSELKVERGYNARGYLSTLADATTGTSRTLVTYGAMDAYGNIETETFGNGAQTTRAHDPKTGRATAIGTSRGTSTFQNHAYAWLTDGSLASRTANAAGSGATARTLRKEEFDYDYLGRLDSAATKLGGATTASRTLDYGYDNRGNLTSKTSDAAGDKSVTSTMYEQRSAGPHALTGATVGGVVHNFHYDAQGHLERYDAASGDDRFIEWDGRGLATRVTVGTAKDAENPAARETFLYGPGGARYLQEERVEGGRRGRYGRHEVGDDLLRRRLREDDAGVHRWRGRVRDGVDGIGGAHARRPGAACETDAVRELERGTGGDRVPALRPPGLVGLDHGRGGGGTGRPRARPARRAAQAGLDAAAERVGDRDAGGGPRGPDFAGIHGARAPGPDGSGAHERPPVRPAARPVPEPRPDVANPTDGQQWNLYSYAMNSPLSYVDPSGLSFCDPAVCGGVGLPRPPGAGGGYSTRTVSGWSVYVTFGTYYDVPGTDATNPAKRRGCRWVRNRVGFLVPTGDGAWFDGDSTKRCRARMLTIECQHRHRAVQCSSPHPLRTICVTVATPVSNCAAVNRFTPRIFLIWCSKSA